ncbi:hypothetical protein D8674_017238 [Pyrus ussuriensis x Pyrus communis]|uniref:Pre-mRNA-splicing factor SYF1-like n=1 Tax=Pyrus ussuriensis x Pyrus communis TaxID=2448454 RepID=A0A5N5HD71_9ROSA|nr:hypothetical protein D8674_017238 [Pyrus ussuriensis x Pyrus communis]
MQEKARDLFEEGMASVVTVRDFGVIFNSYAEFEDSMISHTNEDVDFIDEENEEKGEEKVVHCDTISSIAEFGELQDVDDLVSLWCEWAEIELRHKNSKQALELIRRATAEPLIEFTKLEEDYGRPRWVMEIYDEATKAVPYPEKLGVYEVNIAWTVEMEGNHKTREIYKKAIESGLPQEVLKTMRLKLIVLEMNYGQIDCARSIYEYALQVSYPRSDEDFWNKWHQFEAQHGNRDTYQNMLRIKRSVSTSKTQLPYPIVYG